MRAMHFPTLRTDDVGVVIATMRHPDYGEGHRRADAPRYGPLVSP